MKHIRLLLRLVLLLLTVTGAYYVVWMGPGLFWMKVSLPTEEHFLKMLRLWAQENSNQFPNKLDIDAAASLRIAIDAECRELQIELMSKIEERKAKTKEMEAFLNESTNKFTDPNELHFMPNGQFAEYKKEDDVLNTEYNELQKKIDELDKVIKEKLEKHDQIYRKSLSMRKEKEMFYLIVDKGMNFILSLSSENDPHYCGMGIFLGDSQTPIFWYKPRKSKNIYRVIYGDFNIKEQTSETLPSFAVPSMNI